jgi:hypothetical protein
MQNKPVVSLSNPLTHFRTFASRTFFLICDIFFEIPFRLWTCTDNVTGVFQQEEEEEGQTCGQCHCVTVSFEI